MKHLLIILISILLLSSPVIGDNHKGETLYMWGKYPDYVWKKICWGIVRWGNKTVMVLSRQRMGSM